MPIQMQIWEWDCSVSSPFSSPINLALVFLPFHIINVTIILSLSLYHAHAILDMKHPSVKSKVLTRWYVIILQFYNNLSTGLKDIVWKYGDEVEQESKGKQACRFCWYDWKNAVGLVQYEKLTTNWAKL